MRLEVQYLAWNGGKFEVVKKTMKVLPRQAFLARLGYPVFLNFGRLSRNWSGLLPLFLLFCRKHKWTLTHPVGYERLCVCLLCSNDSDKK